MRLATRFKIPIWIAVWVVTRAFMAVQIGFWKDAGAEYQDVNTYEAWSNWIASTGLMPQEETWQYPPGAAYLFLIPRLGPLEFKPSFAVLMVIVDLIGFWLMTVLARREKRDAGVWVWLLAMPLLFAFPLLRFDLVPTVIAIGALLVLHRRPVWFGALVGLGAMIKVWPAFVLFAEWDRKRLLRSIAAAAAVVVAIFAVSQLAFGDQTGFIDNQKDRGLQIESVAATPWQLRTLITETPAPLVGRFGTLEIGSDLADAVGKALSVAAFLILLAAAWWWWMRDRAIRRGRSDLEDEALARDFVFTIVLLFLVTSRVLSPQFMIWMVGLSGVILATGGTRLARPAWIVVGSIVLTAGLYQSPANAVIRNLALVFAAIDASWTLYQAVRNKPAPEEASAPVEPAAPAAVDSA
ncbi:MAG TPA: glycosyltransferase family 87 protein [Solirubrobacterales bacterium]|nr:glycosyltransferase family 87 protein [Solirubrobacterales bacterium]